MDQTSYLNGLIDSYAHGHPDIAALYLDGNAGDSYARIHTRGATRVPHATNKNPEPFNARQNQASPRIQAATTKSEQMRSMHHAQPPFRTGAPEVRERAPITKNASQRPMSAREGKMLTCRPPFVLRSIKSSGFK
jgi:uncharacterized protein involved in copper resistance